jgi:hypothetical protein
MEEDGDYVPDERPSESDDDDSASGDNDSEFTPVKRKVRHISLQIFIENYASDATNPIKNPTKNPPAPRRFD